MNGKLTLLALGLCALLARPAAAQVGAGPDLVRCDPDHAAPCIRMRLDLSVAEAAAGDAKRWSGAAGTMGFREVDVRGVMERPLVLLALFDVSGSMAGQGIGQARSALRAFLRSLGSATQVAVAPFGSRGVVSGIRAARFGTPGEAEAQVDRLPTPAGNTGLYSAVQAGAELVAARLRTAPAGAQGVLLVLTDGRNEVGPDDEPGLLAGAGGRERTVEAVRRSGVPVWTVGIGSGVDAVELAALAGPLGRAEVVAFDPARTLAELRGTLSTTREVTAVLPASARPRLARGETMLHVEHGAPGWSREVRWRPPLIALPAFTGVASPSRRLATARDEPAATTRLVLAFFGTLLVLLWLVVPALLWPVQRPPRVAVRSGRSRQGVRRGVQEAPPRRPSEITASQVRRVVVGS